jgi:predicted DNA-binding protein with PD1-like motif
MKVTQQSETEWVGRFDKDADLLKEIEKFAEENGIESGIFSIIGAVQNVKFGFYDQGEKKYRSIFLEEHAEILHCTGNIAIKGGKPFAHAHIMLADKEGQAFGGHLNGAKIFVAEFYIKKFPKKVERKFDAETNLSLLDETK